MFKRGIEEFLAIKINKKRTNAQLHLDLVQLDFLREFQLITSVYNDVFYH